MLLFFFAAFVLVAVAPAVCQPGFLTIDCGLEANYSGGYINADYGLDFVPDSPYINAGENRRVASEYVNGTIRSDLTLRIFPDGVRNCYTLPTVAGKKYLVRVVAFYGNYDGNNSASTLQFDLHLGVNYWDTVYANDDYDVYEALFVAWDDRAAVCLINTGQGTPFASSVELRTLADSLYPDHVNTNQSMAMYPTDPYDRFWWGEDTNPMWENFNTTLDIRQDSSFEVPVPILQKAVTVAGNGTMMNVTWEDTRLRYFSVFLHFADFESQARKFTVAINSEPPKNYTLPYRTAFCVYSTSWYWNTDGQYNVSLVATDDSKLPPMFNAYEIYTLITHDTPTTYSKDVNAIMAIQLEYAIKKNWMGDPCFPEQYKWDGVKCKSTSDNIQRIIYIDLSNSNLHGAISRNFSSLTALDYESGRDMCNNTTGASKNRTTILAISVIAPVLVVLGVIFIGYLIWRARRKLNVSNNPPREFQLTNPPESEKYDWDHLQKVENRQFTYEELKNFTNNFQRSIGKGGFGCVYHGCLEDNTEVAVKICSEKSSHGFNEFLAEVQSLRKVHHKNLVYLVGYCSEKDHLALVYEYMSRGNLFDLLRGRNDIVQTLKWHDRVRIALEAAQGLDYLHTGCVLPIIHRDLKSHNILLGHDMVAKISDFGLSKSYLHAAQSHISATTAGTPGYIDPALLVTGEPPIIPTTVHIVQRVKEKVFMGNIEAIVDPQCGNEYDANSIWKVVDIALLCTKEASDERPAMSTVIAQLKDALALEEARASGSTSDISQGAATQAVAQPGFLSVDCGLEAEYSGYKDSKTGIVYVSDERYVDSGESHRVASGQDNGRKRSDITVRSFPTGVRNCYTLPTVAGKKYMVRVIAFYGNYDGKNSSSQYDLYLGVNYWTTVSAKIGSEVYEAMFMAWASWAPVCLINTGDGTPFVSTVELRLLADGLYKEVMANQSMARFDRRSMGSSVPITRYQDDPYDRYWYQMVDASWADLSTMLAIDTESTTAVPTSVLQTAVTPTKNNTVLLVTTWEDPTASRYISSKFREFDASPDVNQVVYNYTPPYMSTGTIYTSWFRADDGRYNISLAATAKSALPPMLNAFEVYFLINHDMPMTFPTDFDAIMTIKLEYDVKKNWMGDPCFPPKFAWDGVKCRNMSGNIMRIISLDLSNSNLHGPISNNFTLLTALENLNQLNGPIPDSLCKNNGGQFIFRYVMIRDCVMSQTKSELMVFWKYSYGSGGDMCNKTVSLSSSRKRMAILAISVVVPVLLVAVLILAYLIWRVRRKPNIPELRDYPASITNHLDHLHDTENRLFTYEELKKLTNNFQRLIGRGGFGSVYYGRLENNREVAVKIRSEYSRQGLHQFLAEVKNLTKVHQRNLVSLVGSCWEKEHLALVYEYMSAGSLSDHLRGKIDVGETLNWATRLRIALEAAQGLDCLHKGCNLPIIHRDVKTNNILLDQNLKSKLADFGLSKTYISDTQTHVSTNTAAGTPGYIDPMYQLTGKLTESSDVYSFGVVLLEVATGLPPVLPDHDHTHVTEYVKNNITSGNISSVADARLKESYDISSMRKVVDTAMLCTEYNVSRRPTMSSVIVQLKQSLALEEARVGRGVGPILAGDSVDHVVSKNGP
uniref:Protein kinase domain-containing protein n=1 Tax=Leersia perrieri TaxID=77586 RepID=A0A0D9XCU5_9ORYZ